MTRFEQLKLGAARAMLAINTDDAETLLATLGVAVTNALMELPVGLRYGAAKQWMERLAASLISDEDGHEPRMH